MLRVDQSILPVAIPRAVAAGSGAPVHGGHDKASRAPQTAPVTQIRGASGSTTSDRLSKDTILLLQEEAPSAAPNSPTNSDQVSNKQPDGNEPSDGQASSNDPADAKGGANIAAEGDVAAGEPSEEEADADGLTEEEEKQVRELAARDREVRAHEQAHARVGGAYAGAPSYTFQQGPDGKRYAIGGEVSIDTSSERTPEATVRKMQVVIRAATAPAEPSPQDMKVAQQARSTLQAAQAEVRAERAEDLRGEDNEGGAVGEGQSAPAADEGSVSSGVDRGAAETASIYRDVQERGATGDPSERPGFFA
ncbi:MAG: hypothetical protein HWE23_09025 [Rhodobacteraceae bacterium]|nr:hypothetical protein [Paracoccaceae bacterium]